MVLNYYFSKRSHRDYGSNELKKKNCHILWHTHCVLHISQLSVNQTEKHMERLREFIRILQTFSCSKDSFTAIANQNKYSSKRSIKKIKKEDSSSTSSCRWNQYVLSQDPISDEEDKNNNDNNDNSNFGVWWAKI